MKRKEQKQIIIEAARQCFAGNDAESVVPVPAVHHGRLGLGGPCPTHQRLKHQARLVQKHDTTAAFSGVFLCAASAADATARWPARPAPGRGARASGCSTASTAGRTRRGRGGTGRRSSPRSPRPPVPTSTGRCCSRACGHLAAAASPDAAAVPRSTAPASSWTTSPYPRSSISAISRRMRIRIRGMNGMRRASSVTPTCCRSAGWCN